MIKRLTAIALLVCIIAAFCPTGVFASVYGRLVVLAVITPPAAEGEVYTIDSVKWYYEDSHVGVREGYVNPKSVVWKNYDTGEAVTTFTQGERYTLFMEVKIPGWDYGGPPSLNNLGHAEFQCSFLKVGKSDFYAGGAGVVASTSTVSMAYTTEPLSYPITGQIDVDFAEPAEGVNPTFNPECSKVGVSIGDILWEDLTDDTILRQNARFKDGHDYRVSFRLGTDGYYYYPYPSYDYPAPQVNVNGHAAYVKNHVDSSGFDADYIFGDATPITDVAFDVHLPCAGEEAVFDITETDERFNLVGVTLSSGGFYNGVRWYDETDGKVLRKAFYDADAFTRDHVYKLSVLLESDGVYRFDESKLKSVTVNGIKIVKGENGDYGKYNDYVYQIDFFFPALEKLLKGDMDKDGSITVADALAALRIAAKLVAHTVDDLLAGDIDRDDRITVGDALSILRVAAKLASPASLDPPEIVGKWQDDQGNVLIIEPDRILNDNGETVFMSEVKDDIITFYVIGSEYSFSYRFVYHKREEKLVFLYTDSGETMNIFTRV